MLKPPWYYSNLHFTRAQLSLKVSTTGLWDQVCTAEVTIESPKANIINIGCWFLSRRNCEFSSWTWLFSTSCPLRVTSQTKFAWFYLCMNVCEWLRVRKQARLRRRHPTALWMRFSFHGDSVGFRSSLIIEEQAWQERRGNAGRSWTHRVIMLELDISNFLFLVVGFCFSARTLRRLVMLWGLFILVQIAPLYFEN